MDGRGNEIEQYLVAFGRGPRRCIGEKLVFRLF
jgi:cytochrome P450